MILDLPQENGSHEGYGTSGSKTERSERHTIELYHSMTLSYRGVGPGMQVWVPSIEESEIIDGKVHFLVSFRKSILDNI